MVLMTHQLIICLVKNGKNFNFHWLMSLLLTSSGQLMYNQRTNLG